MNSEISQRFLDEIGALGGYRDFYNKGIRNEYPNGIKRFVHLVPEIAPDQAALARLLAQFAVEHRKEDLSGDESLEAYRRFEFAKGNQAKIKLLARQAANDSISWEACEYFLLPENRVYIHEGEKRLAPIPEHIQNLMQQCFRGEVKRSNHTPLDLRDAAIVFAVRLTLEADISATAGNPNACQVVADLIPGLGVSRVRALWQERSERPLRGTKLNR